MTITLDAEQINEALIDYIRKFNRFDEKIWDIKDPVVSGVIKKGEETIGFLDQDIFILYDYVAEDQAEHEK